MDIRPLAGTKFAISSPFRDRIGVQIPSSSQTFPTLVRLPPKAHFYTLLEISLWVSVTACSFLLRKASMYFCCALKSVSVYMTSYVVMLLRVWLFCHPMDCSPPGSMLFTKQEYCSGLWFPSPGDLHDPETEPVSPALAGGIFTTEPPGKPHKKLQLRDLSLWKSTWKHWLPTPVQAAVFLCFGLSIQKISTTLHIPNLQ